MKVLVSGILLWSACQQGEEFQGYCKELSNQYSDPAITLATGEARCAEVLQFGSTVESRYGMGFSAWLETVLPQRAEFEIDAIEALSDRSDWAPVSFDFQPLIPCGGIIMTDVQWKNSLLSKIVRQKPSRIYVSLGILIDGNQAKIRVKQDFDCDGVPAVTEMVGTFKQGIPSIAGGWQPISTHNVEIDE
ncbi:MAG TPA: hypothetical protein VG963_09705 [Polyangiaceae bacterium]|nr:hypothetical protein [Polyangiaceae bacterium]